MKRVAVLGGIAALSTAVANAGVVDPGLVEIFRNTPAETPLSTLVYLQDRVDAAALTDQLDAQRATLATRHEVVVLALQAKAAETQGDLVAHLETLQEGGRIKSFTAFWVANFVAVEAVQAELELIAAHPDVARVYYDYPIEGIRPVEPVVHQPAGPQPVGTIEPGVLAVRAPEVWAMGITGAGTLVSTLDTGVDGSHPALADRWRGLDPAYAGHPEWAFFDPVTNWTFPQDSGSHGTHTMGTVTGGPPGDQIGVAPGAEWIHAAVIDRVSLQQTITDALLAFQWLIDPDGDPATNFDVADVNSNSWGLADFHNVPDCDDFFWDAIDNCEAAGIVVLFSAGNEGFGGLRRPADRATDDFRNLAVAAVDGNVPSWPIASFSSRGPTFCGPGGQKAIKPDISAPGVNVRSSVPGGYSNFSGTSMASPHINGVVALMRQANPDISVEQVKQIIYDTAFDLGGPGEDNDYGWGMVDAFEAVQAALGTTTLTFTFPEGLPDVLDPNGGTTVPVIVSGSQTDPVPGTGTLYYSAGGPFTSVLMDEVAPNEYDAVFPAFACLAEVDFYFSAEAETGDTIFNPFSAPDVTYSAEVYTGIDVTFQDDFETDMGWAVTDSPGLQTGTWDRGVPVPTTICNRGNPGNDADGSGQCYLTWNSSANACDTDVDNGATTLTSPVLDASDPDSFIGYWRWYSNTEGGSPNQDIFEVEVSDNGGSSWVNLETVGPAGPGTSGGWVRAEFLVADIPGISNTSQFQIRFTASDTDPQSIVEAAVDGIEIFNFFCDADGCPADLDGSGDVGITDMLLLLAAWGPNPGHPADLDGNGDVGVPDFLQLLAEWGPCP